MVSTERTMASTRNRTRAPRHSRNVQSLVKAKTSTDAGLQGNAMIETRKRKGKQIFTTKDDDGPVLNKYEKRLPVDGKINKSKLALSKEQTTVKSGRNIKKTKDNLKLFDGILKSELLINDSSINRCQVVDGQETNNNTLNISNEDAVDVQTCLDNSSGQKLNKSHKKLGKKLVKRKITLKKHNHSRPSKTKQVTLSNGVVLTLELFECDYCHKTFSSKSSLRRHIYLHLNLKAHKCSKCSKSYQNSRELKVHVCKKLSDKSVTYICNKCDMPFLLKENLILHLSTHVKSENSVKCIYCEQKFSHQLLLSRHEKQHLVEGRHQCSICKISYNSRARLTLHVKTHLNIKEYICQYCGKEFLRPNSVRRHVEICHGGHRIQCPICKKMLKGHLTEHLRTHDNKRPHVCPDCGQGFTQSTQLTVHRRSHSGVRPYVCKICDRAFSHSNALMLHIRRHTGEKPFACAMCPKSFSQLPHMKAHMKKIHGKEASYLCRACKQFFKLKVQLEDHARVCGGGERALSFEERLQASVAYQEPEVEAVMSVSKMRFLLALLLTMIASKAKLKYLGFNKRLIDDLLVESLEAMGHRPCTDAGLTPHARLRANIDILLNGTVPPERMATFRREKKTTEELLILLTGEKKKKQ